MDDFALTALILLAAVLHASWNALVKAGSDKLVMQALVIGGAGGCMALLAPFVGFPDRAAWPYLALSALLHLTYNVSLVRAYQRGDLSQVYPIARGAAPAFVALGAWLALGETLNGRELAGLAALSLGIASLAFGPTAAPAARGEGGAARAGDERGSAVAWSLLTAAWIGAYSVADGAGVRLAGDPLRYIVWMLVLDAAPLVSIALWLRRGRIVASFRPVLARGLLAGVLSAIAYGIVLWAMSQARIAHVAALRETSVIVAAAIGTLLLGEPFGRPRLLAAALVVAGAMLLRSG